MVQKVHTPAGSIYKLPLSMQISFLIETQVTVTSCVFANHPLLRLSTPSARALPESQGCVAALPACRKHYSAYCSLCVELQGLICRQTYTELVFKGIECLMSQFASKP